MNIIKRFLLLLLTLLMLISVCGCMGKTDYANIILNELERKYNKTFEIEQITHEFSGDSGEYYRAVCKDAESGKSFVAKYYADDKELFDEYCALLLNEDLINYLTSSDLGIAHAVVDVITVEHVLTMDDIAKGVEYCLSNEDFDVKVSAYIFLDKSFADNTEIENKIVDKLTKQEIYRCGLDVIYMSGDALDSAKNEYTEVYMLDDSLEKDARIVKYRRYLISKESGALLTETVKGE